MAGPYAHEQIHTPPPPHPERSRRPFTSITPRGLKTQSSTPRASIKRASLLEGKEGTADPLLPSISSQSREKAAEEERDHSGELPLVKICRQTDAETQRESKGKDREASGKGNKNTLLNLFCGFSFSGYLIVITCLFLLFSETLNTLT